MIHKLLNTIKSIMLFGAIGAFTSYWLFVIMQNICKATDIQGFILISTITICTTICCCTALLVTKK
ncbi:hypothetical protein [Clostridium aciditolerans]|uniref:Uncharacterized protein n=1 Tax=Clostridium aciditolerans TaxID=339861 RepID=A0A934M3Z0_9CLOT|nr:hypothetical protein [Clostridium aciditolerans]MBI6872068.1 hypothetical protein [Clostridium aciditolerans]